MNPWIPALGWFLLLLWLTLTPRPLPGELEAPGRLDLAGHLLLFAGLAALVARAAGLRWASSGEPDWPHGRTGRTRARRGGRARALAIGAVLVGIAAADELLQPPIAGRDAAWSDFFANLAGIGLGLAVAARIAARRRAPEATSPTVPAPPGTAAGSRESAPRSRRRR